MLAPAASALLTGRTETATRRIREKLWENVEKGTEMLDTQADKIEEEGPELNAFEHGKLIAEYVKTSREVVETFDALALTQAITGVGVRRLTGDADSPSPRRSGRSKPVITIDAEES